MWRGASHFCRVCGLATAREAIVPVCLCEAKGKQHVQSCDVITFTFLRSTCTFMAFQLPQQPRDARVVLPAAPQNPQVLADVHRAVMFQQNTLDAGERSLCYCTPPRRIDSSVLTVSFCIAINAPTPDNVSRAAVLEHSGVVAGAIDPGKLCKSHVMLSLYSNLVKP
jgi:hypothetical protein